MGAAKWVVLGTGGTIAGTAGNAHDNVGYSAAQLGVAQLLAAVPSLAGLPVACEQVAQVDSKDMDAGIWCGLALRCQHWLAQPGVGGVLITHGTDTLEETAYFLARVLASPKPVVLTCAMRPATSLQADGPQNLRDAFAVLQDANATGVLVVAAGRVHAAEAVAKCHPYRLDAFTSGEAGPLAVVEEGAVRWLATPPAAVPAPAVPPAVLARERPWPRVELVLNHAGADGRLVDALMAQGVDGLVAAGTGNGTLSQPLEAALLRAQAAGVRVVRSTRCAEGRVIGAPGDVLQAVPLSPVKARVALQLALLAEGA